jgi:osmotically-inducible protein OsmY
MSQDRRLQESVLAELSWEPSLTAAHIGVTAQNGVVTLTGHVGNFAEKRAAETAAGRVKGVAAVAEEIEVRLPDDRRRGDAEIAAAALELLAWDVSVPRDAITVKVEKGWITLTGQVDRQFQRDAAEQDVHRLFGILGVSNETTIKPTADGTSISEDIKLALHRSWFFDPSKLSIDEDGGSVRLAGTVRSPSERARAVAAAWGAAGTTDVVNDIIVV